MFLVDSAIKLTIGFFLLIATGKLLGRQQLSQVSLFDFISAMILGEIIGNALYDDKISIWYVILNLFIWTSLKIFMEKVTLKSELLRSLIDGKPSVIIRRGELDMQELKKHHLNLHQLFLLAREQNVFSLSEIDYAIFESDGQLTVMKKSQYQIPTRGDLELPINSAQTLPFSVIIDGEILHGNLALADLDEDWLLSELRKQGYFNPEQISYAEIKGDKELFVLPCLG